MGVYRRRLGGAGRPDDVLAALVGLLDHSYAEIHAMAAQPHTLDRRFVVEAMDLWSHHVYGTFRAASRRTARGRRRAAVAELRDMWQWAGPAHRAWMVRHLTAAGLTSTDFLVDRDAPPVLPYRDHAGRLQPVPEPLTASAVPGLLADYELDGGRVDQFLVELAGPAGRPASGVVGLTASRRRYRDDEPSGYRPAKLRFFLREVHRYDWFGDAGPDSALAAAPQIEVDGAQVTIRLVLRSGQNCVISGRGVSYLPEDDLWHSSSAARAVTEVRPATPAHQRRRPPRWWRRLWDRMPRPATAFAESYPWLLVAVQHEAVLKIRSIRYARLTRAATLHAVSGACLGLATTTAQVLRTRGRARRGAVARKALRTLYRSGGAGRRLLSGPRGYAASADVPLAALLDDDTGSAPRHQDLPGPVPVTPENAAGLPGAVDFTGGRIRFARWGHQSMVDETGGLTLHLEGVRRDGGPPGEQLLVVLELAGPNRHHLVGERVPTVLTGPVGFDFPAGGGVTLTLPVAGAEWTVAATGVEWYPGHAAPAPDRSGGTTEPAAGSGH